MQLAIDCHTHLYPKYDLRQAFACALTNLEELAKLCGLTDGHARAILLTERWDCDFFSELKSGKLKIPNFDLNVAKESGVVTVSSKLGDRLFVYAGRQIVSAERLEFLSLLCEQKIEDGLPAEELIGRISQAGGLAVINWAPGKWFFSRGKLVRNLLERFAGQLLLCDTSLRVKLWPEPQIMRNARAAGVKILAGSDPLPLWVEEKRIGTLGLVFQEDFDPERPLTSLRALLSGVQGEQCGVRLSIWGLVTRLLAMRFS